MYQIMNQLKDQIIKSIKKSDNESIEKTKKESEEESIILLLRLEPSSLNNKSTTNWYNEILTTIDNSNFNHQNEIGKLKFNDINDLINNIKNNTISEADTKNKINKLNEIKKVNDLLKIKKNY